MKKGQRFYSEHFILITNLSAGKVGCQPCFAFIVSKKIDKKAVGRNRLKRQLREIARQNLSKTKNGYDIIILARKTLMENSGGNIKAEIKKLFKQAKLIK